MIKKILLGLLSLTLVGAAGGVLWFQFIYLKQPGGKTVWRQTKDTWSLLAVKKQFEPKRIAETCPGTPIGRLYEECFTPKIRQFQDQNEFGVSAIMLKAVIGVSVLMQDKNYFKKSGIEDGNRFDFLMLGLILTSLREAQAYQPIEEPDENLRATMVTKLATQYVQSREKLMEKMRQNPKETDPSLIALKQYDAAYEAARAGTL
jgi:hypothetical protein